MPLALRRFLIVMFIPAPFLLGTWIVAAWMIFVQTPGGFLGLLIAVPVAFIQMAVLALMLWLRPSVRLSKELTGEDALWYVGTFVLWAVGAALQAPWGSAVMLLAFLVGAVGTSRIGRRSQLENRRNMEERTRRMREHLAEQAAGGERAWGPDAGRVITIDTSATSTPRDAYTAEEDRPGRGGAVVEAELIEDEDEEPGRRR